MCNGRRHRNCLVKVRQQVDEVELVEVLDR